MRYVVFNRKGGVGKSTIVCNLAAVAARRGHRTLVVDLDPQGNATQYLSGREPGELAPNLHGFFEETLGFRLLRTSDENFVHPTSVENLDVLPSDPELTALHAKLEARHKIYTLRDLLESLHGTGDDEYEVIYIDTPPAVNFYTISSLIAAETCLIPFDCDEFSRRALYQLMETVEEVREDHNPDLAIGGVVVNQFQARANLPAQLVQQLRDEGYNVLEPFLGSTVKIRESHQQHRPLVDLMPRHKVSGQFEDLYDALPHVAD